jgi:hypothetical protein
MKKKKTKTVRSRRSRLDIVHFRHYTAVPRLLYPHEFDPQDNQDRHPIVRQKWAPRGKGKKEKETYYIPKITLLFPSPRLRDRRAPGPILGLTKGQVQFVLDQTFAVPFKDIPSIEFLFHEAAHFRSHPLLEGFDTAVRDSLHSIAQEIIFKAFELLSDYMYDPEKKGFVEYHRKHRWHHLAVYLFWAEPAQTGAALPLYFSKIDEQITRLQNRSEKISRDKEEDERLLKEFQDIQSRHYKKLIRRRRVRRAK